MSEHNQYPRYEDLQAELAAARELLDAIRDALAVPYPADISPTGTLDHLDALRDRAGLVRAVADTMTTTSTGFAWAVRYVREIIAAEPIPYQPFAAKPLPILDEQAVATVEDAETPTSPTDVPNGGAR